MGVDTIKAFIDWCKKHDVKPCYASSVLAHGGIRAALKFQNKMKNWR